MLSSSADNAQAHLTLGRLELVAARWEALGGRAPSKSFEAAEESLRRALEKSAKEAKVLRSLAEVHRFRSAWDIGQGRGARAGGDIRAGLDRIKQAIAVDPTMPSFLATQGALYTLQASIERDPAARLGLLNRARSSLEEAMRGSVFLKREFEPVLVETKRLLVR